MSFQALRIIGRYGLARVVAIAALSGTFPSLASALVILLGALRRRWLVSFQALRVVLRLVLARVSMIAAARRPAPAFASALAIVVRTAMANRLSDCGR